jgi:hypothetical protein
MERPLASREPHGALFVSSVRRSAKLLHHDPIVLDFV